jgi:uncharacterized metal-binding protein YceD (DUF177 family)
MNKPLKAFDIEFVKLNYGEHQFDFSIDDDFFKAFESSLKAEDLKLNLLFTKSSGTFTLLFQLIGKVKIECDRCLTEINLPIKSENTLMVKITENLLEDQDDIIYILPNEYKLNISQPLYDFILLSLPIKKTCDKVGKVCDSTITEKITQVIDVELQTTDAERTTDLEEED